MKKSIGILFFLILVPPVFAAGLKVKTVEGKAEWRPPGSLQTSEVEVGAVIQEGSRLKLEKDCKLSMYSEVGHEISFVGPAYFKLTLANKGKEDGTPKIDGKLFRGAMRCKVKKIDKEQVFEVKTPTAVAGVRGTEFDCAVADNGVSVVEVNEGFVSVSSGGESVVISEGQAAKMSGGITKGQATGVYDSAEKEGGVGDLNDEGEEVEVTSVTGIVDDTVRQASDSVAVETIIEEEERLYDIKLEIEDIR